MLKLASLNTMYRGCLRVLQNNILERRIKSANFSDFVLSTKISHLTNLNCQPMKFYEAKNKLET